MLNCVHRSNTDDGDNMDLDDMTYAEQRDIESAIRIGIKTECDELLESMDYADVCELFRLAIKDRTEFFDALDGHVTKYAKAAAIERVDSLIEARRVEREESMAG